MKPRMKPDVYWTQVPEGVFLLGSPGQRTLKGRSLHRWIDRLAPHFDGSRTLEQIAGHLPRDQRDMVTRLVDVLTDAGYLVDASGDSPHDLSPAEVSAYGDMIAHIAYHRSSPERAFQDYRRSRLLIVGSGLTLRCLTHAALRAGAGHVLLADRSGKADADTRLGEIIDRATPDQGLRCVEHVDAADKALEAHSAAVDAVLHVDAGADPRASEALERSCRENATLLAQARVLGDSAWIGPVPGDENAWQALGTRLRGTAPADVETAGPSQYLTGPTVSLIAHHLHFALLRHLTGIGPAAGAFTFTEIELETLITRTRRVVPTAPVQVPAASSSMALCAAVAELARGEPVDDAAVVELAPPLFEPRVGVFTEIDEREFTQIPFHVAQVTVADPRPGRSGDLPRVLGYGTDFAAARLDATRAAGALYAYLASDQPRPGAGEAHRWALDLHTGDPRSIKADQAHKLPDTGCPGGQRPTGVASARTWDEAVEYALFDACAALCARRALSGPSPLPLRVRHEDLGVSQAARRWLRVLGISDAQFDLCDLSGVLGIPVYALEMQGQTLAYRGAPTAREAVESCLRAAVLQDQACRNSDEGVLLSPVPDLPGQQEAATAPPPAEPSASTADPIRALARAGHRAAAVPLDAGPGVRDTFPYIAQVVITDA